MSIVTLTTDFGTVDPYTGAMKGVILGIAPQARLVDITHDIAPHGILHGAYVLRHIWSWYPPGTIHLAVVDPGVGSSRRIIAGCYDGRYFVGPDNGLISLVHAEFEAEALHLVEDPRFHLEKRSSTFHGRDIMAPVVGRLVNGTELSELGPAAKQLELLAVDQIAKETDDVITGSVLHVDRFGTIVTNIRREQVERLAAGGRACQVSVNHVNLGPVRSTFSDVEVGEPVALIGSFDLLEIAVNRGRAVDRFAPVQSVRVECS